MTFAAPWRRINQAQNSPADPWPKMATVLPATSVGCWRLAKITVPNCWAMSTCSSGGSSPSSLTTAVALMRWNSLKQRESGTTGAQSTRSPGAKPAAPGSRVPHRHPRGPGSPASRTRGRSPPRRSPRADRTRRWMRTWYGRADRRRAALRAVPRRIRHDPERQSGRLGWWTWPKASPQHHPRAAARSARRTSPPSPRYAARSANAAVGPA